MKKEEIIRCLQTGAKVHLCEYRGSVAENMQWRDKTTRDVMRGVSLSHNCEFADGKAFVVSERVEASTFNPLTYQSPFKRGQQVVLVYTQCLMVSGKTSYYGKLEGIEGSEKVTFTF